MMDKYRTRINKLKPVKKTKFEITKISSKIDIINALAKKFGYLSYLEIGVQNPRDNFDRIIIEEKHGIDPRWIRNPNSGFKNEMTSDEFFRNLDKDKKFDLIFIDGLHHQEQIDRDLINSLKHLNSIGTIVLHDCNPTKECMQIVPRISGEWTGDGWKSIFKLRKRKNLSIFVVDIDYGCGVIRFGKSSGEIMDIDLNWSQFNQHRNEILNLISVEEFKKWLIKS